MNKYILYIHLRQIFLRVVCRSRPANTSLDISACICLGLVFFSFTSYKYYTWMTNRRCNIAARWPKMCLVRIRTSIECEMMMGLPKFTARSSQPTSTIRIYRRDIQKDGYTALEKWTSRNIFIVASNKWKGIILEMCRLSAFIWWIRSDNIEIIREKLLIFDQNCYCYYKFIISMVAQRGL